MRDKEVLHLINSSGLGGAETIVMKLIKKRNYRVFCLKKGNPERFLEVSDNVYFGTEKNLYKYNPFIFLKLYKFINRNDIKVLHVHLAVSVMYGLLMKMIKPDLKLIYHEHGEIFQNKKLKYLLKYFKNKFDLFIAVSNTAKNKLVKKSRINEKNISVLYNFIDFDELNSRKIDVSEEKRKLKIGDSEFVLGFAGRLSEIKGCEFLIKSLPYLDFKHKVLIAGEGELRNYLEELTKKLKVDDQVQFLGYVEDIHAFYSLLDVYIMPSLSEASPMAFYEAQAHGVPIIGSNVSAINEFIRDGKNGALFEVKSHYDLAKKIGLLYNNKSLRKKFSERGLEKVKKFSLKKYIHILEILYKKLVSNN